MPAASRRLVCGRQNISVLIRFLREQVKDSVEFVRIVWEEIERSLRDER